MVLVSCKKEKQEVIKDTNTKTAEDITETKDKPTIDYTSVEGEYITVDIEDGTGHGPDTGSNEGISSVAYQIVKQSEAFQQDGFGLSTGDIMLISEDPLTNIVDYSYRHFGDMGSFYTGKVKVVGNKGFIIPGSDKIVEPEAVLIKVMRQALANDNGNTEMKITGKTPISEILQTEHQHMSAYGDLQVAYQLSSSKMDALWAELTALKTFGEWTDQLSVSNNLVD